LFLIHAAFDIFPFVSAVKKKSNFVHKFDIMTVIVCLLCMCAMICTVNLVRIACWILLLCTHVSKCFISACHCFIQSIHISLFWLYAWTTLPSDSEPLSLWILCVFRCSEVFTVAVSQKNSQWNAVTLWVTIVRQRMRCFCMSHIQVHYNSLQNSCDRGHLS